MAAKHTHTITYPGHDPIVMECPADDGTRNVFCREPIYGPGDNPNDPNGSWRSGDAADMEWPDPAIRNGGPR